MQNVHLVNVNCPDERTKYASRCLVTSLHEFPRETHLSSPEWMAWIQFLTAVAQNCRQELNLLSDILGFGLLVDSLDHSKPLAATERTVLGPFHTEESVKMESGSLVSHDTHGEPLLILGIDIVRDMYGLPVEDVKVDVWETDSTGQYDVQHAGRNVPDGRGILKSDERGDFWFRPIVPVPYPIPHDGPVGRLLLKLKRHPRRLSYIYLLLEKNGYDDLVNALYLRDNPYVNSDAVFGVKESLIVHLPATSE